MKYVYALILVLLPTLANAQPPQWGLCSACHGQKGEGGIGPMLAGHTAEYIVDRLQAYRSSEYVGEQSPLMWPNAAALSDEDIKQLAEYISSIPVES